MGVKVTALSGGVGGARMLRGFAALEDVDLTAIVNVGDDDVIYGLHVAPDIDTVIYTLAGQEGLAGWGVRDDTVAVMTALDRFPIDTWFRIGDIDFATNLFRTARLQDGWTLSQVTTAEAAVFDVEATILPASDDPIRTEVHIPGEGWLPFQTYFVDRQHLSPVDDVRFVGVESARPAPGVLEAIEDADLVVIGPSNPPLSIWPMLAIPDVADTMMEARRVVAVSPLIGGRPIKGPADKVMEGLGLPGGTAGVVAAYDGILDEIVVDPVDASDSALDLGVRIRVLPTRISDIDAAAALASRLLEE